MEELQTEIKNKLDEIQEAEVVVFKLKGELNEFMIMRGDKMREFPYLDDLRELSDTSEIIKTDEL